MGPCSVVLRRVRAGARMFDNLRDFWLILILTRPSSTTVNFHTGSRTWISYPQRQRGLRTRHCCSLSPHIRRCRPGAVLRRRPHEPARTDPYCSHSAHWSLTWCLRVSFVRVNWSSIHTLPRLTPEALRHSLHPPRCASRTSRRVAGFASHPRSQQLQQLALEQ